MSLHGYMYTTPPSSLCHATDDSDVDSSSSMPDLLSPSCSDTDDSESEASAAHCKEAAQVRGRARSSSTAPAHARSCEVKYTAPLNGRHSGRVKQSKTVPTRPERRRMPIAPRAIAAPSSIHPDAHALWNRELALECNTDEAEVCAIILERKKRLIIRPGAKTEEIEELKAEQDAAAKGEAISILRAEL
jgi:hypothetical protein